MAEQFAASTPPDNGAAIELRGSYGQTRDGKNSAVEIVATVSMHAEQLATMDAEKLLDLKLTLSMKILDLFEELIRPCVPAGIIDGGPGEVTH
jgi:hypothetical protein